MRTPLLADSAQAAGQVVGTFLPLLVGLVLLAVGYARRRRHGATGGQGSDGRGFIIAGWILAGLGLVGLLAVAAQSQG